jgi:hypothetical protein
MTRSEWPGKSLAASRPSENLLLPGHNFRLFSDRHFWVVYVFRAALRVDSVERADDRRPFAPSWIHSMNATLVPTPEPFIDRRSYAPVEATPCGERRQFTNSHEGLSPAARELAQAIDGYKLMHRRRFITYEEMLAVIQSIGYSKHNDE